MGKNYKWWYLTRYSFKQSSGNLWAFIFNTTVRNIEFLAYIFVWKVNGSNSQIITYLALGRVFDRLLFNEIDGQMNTMIWNGSLTKYLLLPSNYLGIMFFDNIGFNFVRSIVNSFIALVLALALFGSDIILSFNILSLVIFFVVAYIILTFLSYLKGCVGFWIRNNSNSVAVIQAMTIAIGILSGTVIPLQMLFKGFDHPMLWTPFAFLLHHPMQIYLGKYSQVEILQTFVGGITWCLILFVLARVVFKMGLKRNEAVGL